MTEAAQSSAPKTKAKPRGKPFTGVDDPRRRNGRRRGSRAKLGEAFLNDVMTVWQKKGIKALEQAAAENPAVFCAMIGRLLPQQLLMNVLGDSTSGLRTLIVELIPNDPPEGGYQHNGYPAIEHGDDLPVMPKMISPPVAPSRTNGNRNGRRREPYFDLSDGEQGVVSDSRVKPAVDN